MTITPADTRTAHSQRARHRRAPQLGHRRRRAGFRRVTRGRIPLIATIVVVAAACSGMESSRAIPSQPGRFRLDEWSITSDRAVLPSGRQTVTATSLGHLTHELVIVEAADAASLPTKSDGSVDEAALDAVKVGEIADVPAGASRHTVLELRPGSYVAFCNIVGGMGMGNGMGGGMEHVHFNAGMHTEFTVRA